MGFPIKCGKNHLFYSIPLCFFNLKQLPKNRAMCFNQLNAGISLRMTVATAPTPHPLDSEISQLSGKNA